MLQIIVFALTVLHFASIAFALDNGLAITPVLGFNTWNQFACNINETLIKQTATRMVDLGLVQAGYRYLNLDDCWHLRTRDAAGRLQADPEKFPSGMKALGDYIHRLGLKFGIYSDAGLFTCAGFAGSLGHEVSDAQQFADWGVDYLKYDNCFASSASSQGVIQRYTSMRDALNATGRRIVYSVCDWGAADPWLWGAEVGNSWRTDADISASWDSVLRSADNTAGLARFAGPGAWNDPDMLEVGNGQLTIAQQRSHFALWATMKSPLLIGTDLRRVPPSSVAILTAPEVLAINQDVLGIAGDLVWKSGPAEIWAAPLAGGARAALLLNRHIAGPAAEIRVNFAAHLGYPPGTQAVVRDLFGRADLGVFIGSFAADVGNSDVLAVRVMPVVVPRSADAWRPWHDEAALLAQAAARQGRGLPLVS